MSALQQEFWETIEPHNNADGLAIRETPSGFTFGEKAARFGIDAIAEGTLKGFAMTIMIVPSFLWLIPISHLAMGVAGRASITAIAMLVGYALYRYANRGFTQEFQVDTVQREIRIATRNTNGEATLRQTIAMREISSSFIRRPENRSKKSTLNLRLRGQAEPLPLLSASESALVPVLERLMAAARRRAPERKTAA